MEGVVENDENDTAGLRGYVQLNKHIYIYIYIYIYTHNTHTHKEVRIYR